MRTKPVASIPIAPPPARGICPVEARPKRCTRGLCRRQRACAHPPPKPAWGPDEWPEQRRYQELAAWVIKLHGHDSLASLQESLRAQGIRKDHRVRKAARRAERAGLATGASPEPPPGAARRTGPAIRAL